MQHDLRAIWVGLDTLLADQTFHAYINAGMLVMLLLMHWYMALVTHNPDCISLKTCYNNFFLVSPIPTVEHPNITNTTPSTGGGTLPLMPAEWWLPMYAPTYKSSWPNVQGHTMVLGAGPGSMSG